VNVPVLLCGYDPARAVVDPDAWEIPAPKPKRPPGRPRTTGRGDEMKRIQFRGHCVVCGQLFEREARPDRLPRTCSLHCRGVLINQTKAARVYVRWRESRRLDGRGPKPEGGL
jgi:predicted nucleic acid-binding Zn ribbon protein